MKDACAGAEAATVISCVGPIGTALSEVDVITSIVGRPGSRIAAILPLVVLLIASVAGCVGLPKKDAVQATHGEGRVNRDVDAIDASDRYIVYGRTISEVEGGTVTVSDGLYAHDLKKGTEQRIGDGLHRVRVSGSIAVWVDGGRVLVHDISNGSTVPLAAPGIVGRPDISDDRVVWAASRVELGRMGKVNGTGNGTGIGSGVGGDGDGTSGTDLVMVDLRDGRLTRLTNTSSTKGPPSISMDKVVWVDTGLSGSQIFLLDMAIGNVTRITTWALQPVLPEIWGDVIVWIDHRPDLFLQCSEVYAYDISRGEEFPVSDTCGAVDLDIWGDSIVWEDISRENNAWESGDIMMFELGRSRTTVLTDDRMSQWCPAVNGDVVAWGDDRNSKGDIFVHKLRPETLFGVDIYIIYVLIAAMVITLCALGLVIVSQRKVRPPPRTVKEEMEREEEVGLDNGMERTARSDGDGGSKVKGEDAARGPKSARPPLMRGPYKR